MGEAERRAKAAAERGAKAAAGGGAKAAAGGGAKAAAGGGGPDSGGGFSPPLAEALLLRDASARQAWLTRHPQWRSAEGVKVLDATIFELVARDARAALALADLAVAAARRLDEGSRLLARAARARALFRSSRYEECERAFEAIARRHEARGDHSAAGRAQLSRIGPLNNLGRLDEALEAAESARRHLQAVGDRAGLARLEGNVGMIHHRRGRLREALTAFGRARPVFARSGDRLNVAILDLNRAQAHSQLGHPARAGRLFARARAVFVELGQDALVASTDYNRACDHFTNGRFDRAWVEMEAARAASQRLGDADGVARAELDLAEMAWSLGAAEEAGRHAASARAGFEALGAQVDAARASSVEALVLARAGELERACDALRAAASVFNGEGDRVGASLARLELASLLVEERPAEAARLAAGAARVLQGAGLRNAATRALLVQGLARAASGRDPAGARRLLRRARGLAQRRGVPDLVWKADEALGGLDLRAGRATAARVRLDRAVTAVDDLRTDLRRLEPASWVLADRTPLYEQAIRAWLPGPRGGNAERAFLHAERARSHDLADALTGAAVVGSPLLLGRPAVAAELESESAAGRRERTEPVRPQAELLRAALRPDEQLVEYQRVGGELWAFVVDSSSVEAVRVSSELEGIADRIERLDFLLGKHELGGDHAERFATELRRSTEALLDELGEDLLAPLRHHLTRERLIFVPTRSLHRVPFAALRLGGKSLVEQATTSLAPSALVLSLLRRRRRRGRGALVVGVGDEKVPQVEEEAREVAALLKGSRLLLGAEADRESLFREVKGKEIVHLATHGQFRRSRPTSSALQLADGWLTLRDVVRLPLSARLVTLAACHSGRSEVRAGDEALGLARGVLQAGARAVLVAGWSLDDSHSRQLMALFYARFAASSDAAAALREAILAHRSKAPHPYQWASFQLVGAP